ncbi:hypothetical protein [Wolbachia endosymbiont of Brugia malayi]|uniref:hypothetical protein n=1 Tax=Wolbachia endosymbiont of Brugia malayi TaxID=80849 RepID=UPI00031DAE52|nr:hypothetical protein [Wolbachia endosymbiont of Brugia malayi]
MTNKNFYYTLCRVSNSVNNDCNLSATNIIEKMREKLKEETNRPELEAKKLRSTWKEILILITNSI